MKELKKIIDQRVAAYKHQVQERATQIKLQQQAQQHNMEIQHKLSLEYQQQEHNRRTSQTVTDNEFDMAMRQIQEMKKRDYSANSKGMNSASASYNNNSQPMATIIPYPDSQFQPSVAPKAQLQDLGHHATAPPLPPHPDQYSTQSKSQNEPSLNNLSSTNGYLNSSQPDPNQQALTYENSVKPSEPAATEIANGDSANTHKIRAWTEGGESLRSVFLPTTLRDDFLRIAEPNTKKHLETCGLLCGVLIRNAFFITHLLIPHQKSTPDTCQTTHEEYWFDYLDKHNLILIGWIHTHPTQSCFMSSVDLHTQSSYQLMLKESIAIVCAPTKDPSWDIYRLTDPKGVNVIKKCPKTSFHPHPETDIYASSVRHGHVTMTNKMPFKVVDLRSITPED